MGPYGPLDRGHLFRLRVTWDTSPLNSQIQLLDFLHALGVVGVVAQWHESLVALLHAHGRLHAAGALCLLYTSPSPRD